MKKTNLKKGCLINNSLLHQSDGNKNIFSPWYSMVKIVKYCSVVLQSLLLGLQISYDIEPML